jgi:UDP-glucose 4-epimerase
VNILDVARECNARAVAASSAAIYGHPKYTPIDEKHPFDPTSPFGLDKLTTDYYM